MRPSKIREKSVTQLTAGNKSSANSATKFIVQEMFFKLMITYTMTFGIQIKKYSKQSKSIAIVFLDVPPVPSLLEERCRPVPDSGYGLSDSRAFVDERCARSACGCDAPNDEQHTHRSDRHRDHLLQKDSARLPVDKPQIAFNVYLK